MYQDWLKIISKFNKSNEEIHCPDCNEITISYQFVGEGESRIGHLYLWCNTCLHGIHVSRVKIPDGVEILPFDVSDEILSKKIPRFKLIE